TFDSITCRLDELASATTAGVPAGKLATKLQGLVARAMSPRRGGGERERRGQGAPAAEVAREGREGAHPLRAPREGQEGAEDRVRRGRIVAGRAGRRDRRRRAQRAAHGLVNVA